MTRDPQKTEFKETSLHKGVYLLPLFINLALSDSKEI